MDTSSRKSIAQERLKERRAEAMKRTLEEDKKKAQQKHLADELKTRAQKLMFPHLREATAQDYSEWLEGYVANDGKSIHFVSYPMPTDRYYVATSDFQLVGLYGANSIDIIVPAGINFQLDNEASFGGYGHITLYLMENYELRGEYAYFFSDTMI